VTSNKEMNQQLTLFERHTTDFLEALALIPDNKRRIAPEGEWSAAFIVHHTADVEVHFAARYLLTLGADNPPLIFFDETLYPDRLDYAGRTVSKSLAAIVGIRSMMGETLSKLAPAEWERTMTHNEGKSVTLSRLVEKADGHIVSHAEQLQSLAKHINNQI
jgi:hypothetical protein